MSGRRLNAAVIGGGKISEEHLRFLASTPAARLAGVCDLSPSLANFAAGKFGAERAYTDHRQMLDNVRPDVVHVLTPAATHVPLVRECLQSGAHVICEKPIAPTSVEFETLWDFARRSARTIVEDHNYRFNEPVVAIQRAVARGQLGQVVDVEVRMALDIRKAGGRYSDRNLPHPSHRLPAGVIHEFITHLVYLAQQFIPEFDRVRASWRNLGGDDLFKYDDLDALVFSGSARIRLRFTCQCKPECFILTVHGTEGWAEADLFQPYVRLVRRRKGGDKLGPLVNHFANGCALVRSSVAGFRNKVLQHTPYEGLQTFLNQTYDALVRGTEPPVTYDDMSRASRLIDALLDEENRF